MTNPLTAGTAASPREPARTAAQATVPADHLPPQPRSSTEPESPHRSASAPHTHQKTPPGRSAQTRIKPIKRGRVACWTAFRDINLNYHMLATGSHDAMPGHRTFES